MKRIVNKGIAVLLAAAFLLSFSGCAGKQAPAAEGPAEVNITVFAAASLSSVMEEVIKAYQTEHPEVTFTTSFDSSNTLMQQIEEGFECDMFFSAAQKQMNELADGGYVVDGTRADIVNNQVCVVTYTGSETAVTGLADLADASSIALAGGSVPVGKYTRQALIAAGIIETDKAADEVTTEEVSAALGGVEINECANVSVVKNAVAEKSNEVGTIYYSDLYGFEDQLTILEMVPYDLSGNVIYPAAQIVNANADDAMSAAAASFVEFLKSDTARAIFEDFYFDTNV